MRRLVLLLLSLLLALAFAGIRPAAAWADDDDDGGIRPEDNAAVVVNTEDDSELFDFAFEIRRVAGEVVDNQNAAVAFNQCERCRSVAVAIQIVLVVGSPSVVTPGNVAVAVNYECTLCESLAMAYQFVIGVPADFRFSGEAMSEIKRIRNEIRRLMRADLPIPELRARIDALADRLRQILRDDIARHEERKRRGRDDDDDDDGGGDRRPSPRATPTPTPTTTDTVTEPAETTETATTETETTETETTGTETTVTETTTVP
jgi:putative peptide zinc metalloprotease protein